jgi:hypothetical protein
VSFFFFLCQKKKVKMMMSRAFSENANDQFYHYFMARAAVPVPPTTPSARQKFTDKCVKYTNLINECSTKDLLLLEQKFKEAQASIRARADFYFLDYSVNKTLLDIIQKKKNEIGEIIPDVPTSVHLFVNPGVEIPVLLDDTEREMFL